MDEATADGRRAPPPSQGHGCSSQGCLAKARQVGGEGMSARVDRRFLPTDEDPFFLEVDAEALGGAITSDLLWYARGNVHVHS